MALVIYDHGNRLESTPDGSNLLNEARNPLRASAIQVKAYAVGEKQVSAAVQRTQALISAAVETVKTEDRRRLAVSHIMSFPVHTIDKYAMVKAAMQQLKTLDIQYLVVVDSDMRLLGILSYQDILEAGTSTTSLIGQLYSKKLVAVTPDTLVRYVAKTFVEYQINCLPIVNKKNRVVGIVTRTDLLRLLVRDHHLNLLS